MNPAILKWALGGLGCLFALFVAFIVILGIGIGAWWFLKEDPTSTPVALVTPPAPASVVTPPAPVAVNPPTEISSEELSVALNRPVGSGPEEHSMEETVRIVSFARANDTEHGTIFVPNKAEGQAITVPTPTSPLPRFEFVGVDGSNLEPFVPGAKAKSGRYYVVFRERR
ncbi:MAG: hypothetical protein RL150_30 [Candidatus Parcubacteria bacterium]|jgi:hypothetical protein